MKLTEGQIRYRKYKKSYEKYRVAHRAEVIVLQRKNRDLHRFGGIRNDVLKRDGYKCIECGMTSEEHIEKYKRQLTIDHIDGNGRYSKKPNNDPNCGYCEVTKEK